MGTERKKKKKKFEFIEKEEKNSREITELLKPKRKKEN